MCRCLARTSQSLHHTFKHHSILKFAKHAARLGHTRSMNSRKHSSSGHFPTCGLLTQWLISCPTASSLRHWIEIASCKSSRRFILMFYELNAVFNTLPLSVEPLRSFKQICPSSFSAFDSTHYCCFNVHVRSQLHGLAYMQDEWRSSERFCEETKTRKRGTAAGLSVWARSFRQLIGDLSCSRSKFSLHWYTPGAYLKNSTAGCYSASIASVREGRTTTRVSKRIEYSGC